MVRQVPIDLFTPGPGSAPPYLAGRENEQNMLAPLAASLKRGAAPSSGAVIYGPRGNGKTVLMNAFLGDLKASQKLEVVKLTPDKVPTLTDLCQVLAVPGAVRQLGHRVSNVGGAVQAGAAGLSGRMEGQLDLRPAEAAALLTDTLRGRVKRKPLVLAIDEAHTLDIEAGRALLNAAQDMTGESRPMLLLLVGTPGLTPHLNRMESTFWERNEIIPVGRLSQDEIAQALAEPLKPYGVTFDPQALEAVAADCDGYPHFAQLWGRALTRERDPETRIGLEAIEQAFAQIEAKKLEFYDRRREELRRSGLLAAAQTGAALFGNQKNMNIDRFLEAVNLEDADGLERLGYIWKNRPGRYAAGIPSLMNYVLKQQAAPGPALFGAFQSGPERGSLPDDVDEEAPGP